MMIMPFGRRSGYDIREVTDVFQTTLPVLALMATSEAFVPVNRYRWSNDNAGEVTTPEPIETQAPTPQTLVVSIVLIAQIEPLLIPKYRTFVLASTGEVRPGEPLDGMLRAQDFVLEFEPGYMEPPVRLYAYPTMGQYGGGVGARDGVADSDTEKLAGLTLRDDEYDAETELDELLDTDSVAVGDIVADNDVDTAAVLDGEVDSEDVIVNVIEEVVEADWLTVQDTVTDTL